MTRIIIAIAAFTLMLNQNLISGEPTKPIGDMTYCAEIKDSTLVIMRDGIQLTEDIVFDNGTEVKTDGRVIFPDGVTATLKAGDCIDKSGIIKVEKDVPIK